MGDIYYGAAAGSVSVPDRLLAHVKVAMTTKLRRGESFTLSWQHVDPEVPGRSSLWIHPAIELRFVFDRADPEELDPRLLQRLVRQADTNSGLSLELADRDERGDRSLDDAA